MEKTEKRMRIGHDNFVISYECKNLQECGCSLLRPESLEIQLNGSPLTLSEEQRKRAAILYERLLNLKTEFTYGKMEEGGVKTAVFLKDLADAMEKYYKVQIALVINPQSAAGEMETRTFEDLVRDIVTDLVFVKKEVAKTSGKE